ncbi:MAG: hypothetical protein ACJ8H8_33270, partial [Geminicoccaceae bacterium]
MAHSPIATYEVAPVRHAAIASAPVNSCRRPADAEHQGRPTPPPATRSPPHHRLEVGDERVGQ